MARERYVLLGLARPRSEWFARVGRWTTGASLNAEFHRCMSLVEVLARLQSSRPYSAVVVDGGLPEIDRDFFAAAREAGTPVLVIDDATATDWVQLGAARVLPTFVDRESFSAALAAHSDMIGAASVDDDATSPVSLATTAGSVIAVTGTGGVGTSTAATALAQGLADTGRANVLLADLCRRADLAMLHDTQSLIPGVQELIEAHRGGRPTNVDLDRSTFQVTERGYRLLLGLRHHRHWPTIRPRAFTASLNTLTSAFDAVVCDIEPDLDGDDDTGSRDVEDRHTMARQAVRAADAVVVVGMPGMKGLHSLVRLCLDLTNAGAPPASLLPVVNQSPRSPRQRAELARAFGELLEASLGDDATHVPSPLHLPVRRIDEAFRDGARMPKPLPGLLREAVSAVMRANATAATSTPTSSSEPRRIQPGSLGFGGTEQTA